MKKIYLILPILFTILTQCSESSKYLQLQTIAQNNAQKIDTLSVIVDSNYYEIVQANESNAESINNLEERFVALEIIQSKISLLESKLNNIDSQISSQQETLNSMQKEEIPKPIEQKEFSYEEIYQEARNLYIDNEFQESISKFTKFIEEFPDSILAANSQYWIGECYYSLEQYETAIFQFDKVVINYPTSEKVADAKLKIAFCLSDMGEYEGALTQLREIQKQFPDYERMDIVEDKIIQLENQ